MKSRLNKLIGAFGNLPAIAEGIKNRIFTNEDVEEIERYISAVANKHYDLKGLFSKKAFDEGGNLHFVELQNLSEILGSKCNSLLLANGVLHYTMYVLTKP